MIEFLTSDLYFWRILQPSIFFFKNVNHYTEKKFFKNSFAICFSQDCKLLCCVKTKSRWVWFYTPDVDLIHLIPWEFIHTFKTSDMYYPWLKNVFRLKNGKIVFFCTTVVGFKNFKLVEAIVSIPTFVCYIFFSGSKICNHFVTKIVSKMNMWSPEIYQNLFFFIKY